MFPRALHGGIEIYNTQLLLLRSLYMRFKLQHGQTWCSVFHCALNVVCHLLTSPWNIFLHHCYAAVVFKLGVLQLCLMNNSSTAKVAFILLRNLPLSVVHVDHQLSTKTLPPMCTGFVFETRIKISDCSNVEQFLVMYSGSVQSQSVAREELTIVSLFIESEVVTDVSIFRSEKLFWSEGTKLWLFIEQLWALGFFAIYVPGLE